jgi:benzoyl-CoA reductase/2-hydroxyglutaryl-CoA dehydratase subunit BcrC/BadD/HgdB
MTYETEYSEALQRIYAANADVPSLRFFLDTAAKWHACFTHDPEDTSQNARVHPLVVVLGYGIPEQLIYACGTTPCVLLGGSHASCQWSDDAVPRDSDPASRSILGYALRLAARTDIDPLFVVPVANDNMRKIAYHLKREGHAVLPVDIPTVATSPSAQQTWEHSAETLVQTVARHVGKRVTARSLRDASQLVGRARAAILGFEQSCLECPGVLDSEARLLVTNSYYQTGDLAQWTEALNGLTAEIQARYRTIGRPCITSPRILVVGSPILFPQHKVAELINDAGLFTLANVDAASTSRFANLSAQEDAGGAPALIRAIARKHYGFDSSSASVVNWAMERYVEHLLSSMEVDGVVCHILKGQIEYDFALARLEPLLDRRDIPVFRLETDYQYQDVEQLRIRLEAFAEMLGQRMIVADRSHARRSCA